MDIKKTEEELASAATSDWGTFRIFITTHPLTAWWFGVLLGVLIGYFV